MVNLKRFWNHPIVNFRMTCDSLLYQKIYYKYFGENRTNSDVYGKIELLGYKKFIKNNIERVSCHFIT